MALIAKWSLNTCTFLWVLPLIENRNVFRFVCMKKSLKCIKSYLIKETEISQQEEIMSEMKLLMTTIISKNNCSLSSDSSWKSDFLLNVHMFYLKNLWHFTVNWTKSLSAQISSVKTCSYFPLVLKTDLYIFLLCSKNLYLYLIPLKNKKGNPMW